MLGAKKIMNIIQECVDGGRDMMCGWKGQGR
jgi:hypothetical protein